MNKLANKNEKNPDRIRFERMLWDEGFCRIMGLDEVGRGCLAGPVVAGGVIFEPGTNIKEIKDSKKLSLEERKSLSQLIKEKAVYWTLQWCSPKEIDQWNILQASLKAMTRCTEESDANPDFLLVDGNKFSTGLCPHKCLVKGDDRSMSIAAASIIAKVYRDNWMIKLHDEYPYYGWQTNVGYPTAEHYEGLKEYGQTKHHRQSFSLKTDKIFDNQ
ncbi:RNase HII [Fodinibius salinus]|uniref:Ribonuclease HII n=1 Tax=Fodinibius salinus TaxID=860790 RepID=A0A5D3YJB6_9BACT|nr:ribonuclease HII [Fodinibius salinus]TYP92600.1 RNase HII [Fodinibius salinus]